MSFDKKGRLQSWLIWLPSACAIVAILYFLSYKKNGQEKKTDTPPTSHEHASFSIKSYEEGIIKTLPEDKKNTLAEISKDTFNSVMAFKKIASFWSSNKDSLLNPLLYAYYMATYAKATNQKEELKSIGRLMTIMSIQTKQVDIHNLLLEWSDEVLNRAIQLDPQDDSLLVDVATLSLWYIHNGEKNYPPPMAGIAQMKSVIARNPKQVYAIQHLGMASMMSGQYGKAISYFKQLLAILPNDVNGMTFLGDAFAENGNKKSAKQWYSKALSRAKDKATKNELQGKIKNL